MKQEFHQYIENKESWLSADLVSRIDTYFNLATDTVFEISITGVKSKRSAAQNRFYFGVVLPALVSASMGTKFSKWQKEHWHDCMKEAFLRSKDEVTGRTVTRSTTSLSVEEMSKYIETIINTVLIDTLHGCIEDKHEQLYKESRGI
jgi:hypothetical protein